MNRQAAIARAYKLAQKNQREYIVFFDFPNDWTDQKAYCVTTIEDFDNSYAYAAVRDSDIVLTAEPA